MLYFSIMYLSAYNFAHATYMSIFRTTDLFFFSTLGSNTQHADSLALQLEPISFMSSSFIMTFFPYIRMYVLAFPPAAGVGIFLLQLELLHYCNHPSSSMCPYSSFPHRALFFCCTVLLPNLRHTELLDHRLS